MKCNELLLDVSMLSGISRLDPRVVPAFPTAETERSRFRAERKFALAQRGEHRVALTANAR